MVGADESFCGSFMGERDTRTPMLAYVVEAADTAIFLSDCDERFRPDFLNAIVAWFGDFWSSGNKKPDLRP